jgi:hypothetical protein
MQTAKHMVFTRYGRSYHLRIKDAAELKQIAQLDEAHWVANNAPVSTINCDQVFLRLVDSDENGRITCHEITEAVAWLFSILQDDAGITGRSRTLALSAIDENSPEGQRICGAAKKILGRLNQQDAEQVTLDQVRRIKTQVESMPVSEAGVVLPEAAYDLDIRQFVTDIVQTIGGTPHPSGAEGVDAAHLERFLSAAAAYVKWQEKSRIPLDNKKTAIMPLGPKTCATYDAYAFVKDKIDQYFAQCEALVVDERFGQRIGVDELQLKDLSLNDPGVITEVLKNAAIARANQTQILDFEKPINPYYAEAVEKFRQEAARPVLAEVPTQLTKGQWHKIKSFFAEHESWVAARPTDGVEVLGVEKLNHYLNKRFAEAVRALIAESVNTAIALENIRATEKLIVYQAYMIDLANNFVSFPHLYDPSARAMFEMGTLVMDGRRFDLAVKVENRARHIQVAKTSNMYILYVEITPKDQSKRFEVAIPVTSGGKGNLCIGKHGVFYDVEGDEFDAHVVDIVENPISFQEALLAPFRRLGRLLTGKIESLTSEAEKKLDERTLQAVSQPAMASTGPSESTGRTVPTGSVIMGTGVAIAALGSAAAYITKTLTAISPFRIIAFIVGTAAVLLFATAIVAFLKLRRRDLSAILEGSGWGINARMRLTFRQGRTFNRRPAYPKGSKRTRRYSWPILIILVAAVLFVFGGLSLVRTILTCKARPATPPQEQAQPVTR